MHQAVECMGNIACMTVKELQEHEALNQVVDGALEGDGEKVGRGGAALFLEGSLTAAGGAGGKGVGMAKPRVRPKSPRVKPKAPIKPRNQKKPKRVKNPCPPNSFEGTTLVLMCDGTQRPIEELEEGDWVWARDVLTGLGSCEQITQTFVHEDADLVALTVRSESSGEYERLVVTHDHPMLSPEGEEIAVHELKLDQRLGGRYDDFVVVAIEPLELVLSVYNLSVQNAHTFFVGDAAVWAHNADCAYKPQGALKGKRVGHTFDKHGSHNTEQLTREAAGSGRPQSQWLDDAAAEQLIGKNLGNLNNGAITVPISEGMGRVIMPDGTHLKATHAQIVPSKSGVKTAYPIIKKDE